MSAINFPDNPSLNQQYSDKGFTYKWNGTVWISVGISTTRISNIREIDDIKSSFNGSTTQFPLKVGGTNVTPVTAQQLIIVIGGVIQDPNQDYSLSGANIVFSTPPANGLSFTGTILGTDLPLNTIADDSVTPAKISTGGPSWASDGTVGITSGINIVGVATVGGNAIIGGVATIAGTTQSTSKDTGSLVLEGGLGVEKNIHAGGNLTAVDGSFSGNVTIGGTLTKQDVTNIDSVGVVTARAGIKVNAGGVDISAGGITAAGIASVSAGAAGTVTIGYGNTTLIVDGGARVTGILTVGTSSLTLDGTNNKVNIGSGVTVDATGYRVGGDTFLHATGAALPFLNVAGVTTSTGGFMIGITSATSTVITNGPIKTLNFVGAGNTFQVTGTTVDISIAGGGGGGSTGKTQFLASGIGPGSSIRTQ